MSAISSYTFEEFRQLAENFHGYAAPGLLIGGYMVALAKEHMPEGTLFEAIVETRKCLPDAVQLLTLCSVGNNWMKVINLGRYAVALADKYTGEGVRVSISAQKLDAFSEIKSWLFKEKPKAEQGTERLEQEIRQAAYSIFDITPVTVKRRFLGSTPMQGVALCPVCTEPFPASDGPVCRGCQGEAPYVVSERTLVSSPQSSSLSIVPVGEAVGKVIAHDMTRIEPGVFKGAEFRAGHRIRVGDICRLQQMGKFNIAVQEEFANAALVHENDVAATFAAKMAGVGIEYALPPSEGKIDFFAKYDGLLRVDAEKMRQFNMLPDIMVASRHDATILKKGMKFAGTRAIPLFLSQERLAQALSTLGDQPLFSVLPMRSAKIGVLVTGTEVFKGIIQDKFIPVITAKAQQYGGTVVASAIVPDEAGALLLGIDSIIAAGADMLITTGGLSVDPDDITRAALIAAGLQDIQYGVPVLPGTMSLLGTIQRGAPLQVVGVPACALYFKTTFFDLIFPRLLAGCEVTRKELASFGEGGYCMSCKICTYPKCHFGK